MTSGSSAESTPPPTPPRAVTAPTDLKRWFEEEVHAHDRQLKAYLHSRFPYVRDVEDIVQDSYLRIWKTRATQPIASVKAFLFRIARNSAIDWLRRSGRSPVQTVTDSALPDVMDSGPDVVEVIVSRDEIDLFARALDTLPARCREVLVLRKLQALSLLEIAEKLGVSVNTVEVQLVRGMKRCDEYLRTHGMTRGL